MNHRDRVIARSIDRANEERCTKAREQAIRAGAEAAYIRQGRSVREYKDQIDAIVAKLMSDD